MIPPWGPASEPDLLLTIQCEPGYTMPSGERFRRKRGRVIDTKSTRFEPGEHGQVAVKVIDDRGNELLVVKRLEESE